MLKFIHKILDHFDLCDHVFGETKYKFVQHPKEVNKIVVKEYKTCLKCNKEQSLYYTQEK
jgi:hypothetical protein